LRRLAALPADERRVLAHAVFLVAGFAVALRILPFRVVADRVGRAAAVKGGAATNPRRIAALVDAAGGVLRASCLPRALALSRILRSRGVPHEVRIGIRKRRRLEAHAWVVEGDRVLIGRAGVESYVPLTTLPGPQASR
jgi:Transglutaminase-like superfamily